MKYVTEMRFVNLLNEQLYKDPKGIGMKPFTLGRDGYNWLSDCLKQEEVYRRALDFVRDKYGIAH
jgi:hypothetical protein